MYKSHLPVKEDGNDPNFLLYDQFRKETSRELFNRIAAFIKSKNPDIAISTWGHEGIDIFRSESNTGIDRPLPEWNYSASQNVKTVTASWKHIAPSNTAVHFIDFPYRHSGVSPHLTASRIAQSIANGGWSDYYVIGTLLNQDDRLCFEKVKSLFKFHEQNERYFTNVDSVADICMIAPHSSSIYGSMAEFKGIYRILSENHALFDVIHDSLLESPDLLPILKKYQAVILPDMRNMNEHTLCIVDQYVQEGGKIICTGGTGFFDERGNLRKHPGLKSSGIEKVNQMIQRKRGSYFRIKPSDKEVLSGFDDLDIIYLDSPFMDCSVKDTACKYLGYIPPCMYGPPEKCYYTEVTDIPGVIEYSYFHGKSIFVPWNLGRHYEKLSNHAHSKLLIGILHDLLGIDRTLKTNASPLVEMTSQIEKEGQRQLVSAVNLSGQLGTAFHEPIPMHDIQIMLKVDKEPKKVFSLLGKQELSFESVCEGFIKFTIPRLDLIETVVIEF